MCGKELFMMLCPYKTIKKDFAFLVGFGFNYAYKSKHNVRPCVVYKKQEAYITICYDYYESRFEVAYHKNEDDLLGKTMLLDGLKRGNYSKQLPLVKENVCFYLSKEK